MLVEGQGSINHPGYSGVTLGLLHGSCPDALILCHQATREYIGDYRQAAWLRIPPLSEYVKLYEQIGSAVHPTKVVGIALNTYDLDDVAARRACDAGPGRDGPSVHRSRPLRPGAPDRRVAAGPPALPRATPGRLTASSRKLRTSFTPASAGVLHVAIGSNGTLSEEGLNRRAI